MWLLNKMQDTREKIQGRSSGPWPMVLLVSCILALLSSCGFHLRGVVEMPPELAAVYIDGGLPDSQMREILRQKLSASGVDVLERPDSTAAVLRILKDETSRRIASINVAGQPNEYELKYTLSWQLEAGSGETLLPGKSISQLRTYRYDPDNVLSVEEEEFRIKREMARAAVNQMLRQISAGLRRPRPAADTPAGAS
ncbi:MAG TPA: hypothetical protein ENK45_02670 [Aliiroseovarius sp.]|nr:hypothetical protein [Aliiroseovarius sp.]